VQDSSTAALQDEVSVQGLHDGEEGENGESQGGPVDEGAAALMFEDGEQGPCNGDGCRNITLSARESIRNRSRFEEEQSQEHEDLGPDARAVGVGVHTEGFEGGEDNEDGREAVVEREWEMNPQFIVDILSGMILLDDVVDVGHG